MKKLIALLACLALLFSASACSEAENNHAESTVKNTASEVEFSCYLRKEIGFDSFSAMGQMREYIKTLSDEQIIEYLQKYTKEHGIWGQVLYSREDVERMFDIIADMQLLYLDENSGWKLKKVYFAPCTTHAGEGKLNYYYAMYDEQGEAAWITFDVWQTSESVSSGGGAGVRVENVNVDGYELKFNQESLTAPAIAMLNLGDFGVKVRYHNNREYITSIDDSIKDNLKIGTVNSILKDQPTQAIRQ